MPDITEEALTKASTVKKKYEKILLSKKNVVGVGIGFKENTMQVVIVVNVRKKVSRFFLNRQELIPDSLEGVEVDVVEVGTMQAL